MKFTKYSKYVPDLAGEMSMDDLLNALSDYLLQSGYQDQFSFYEMPGEHTLDDLREAIQRALESGEIFDQQMHDMLDRLQQEGQMEDLIERIIQRIEQEEFISV